RCGAPDHRLALLRPRRRWPSCCCAAKKCDELAPRPMTGLPFRRVLIVFGQISTATAPTATADVASPPDLACEEMGNQPWDRARRDSTGHSKGRAAGGQDDHARG